MGISSSRTTWFTALALLLTFWSGWWGRGVYFRQGADEIRKHYEERLVALLDHDAAHLGKPYEEAKRGARSWNEEFKMLFYIMMRSDMDRLPTAQLVETAVQQSTVPRSIKAQTTAHLLDQHERAKELGLYDTPLNRNKLILGQSPIIHRGVDTGDVATVDHRVPTSLVPQLGRLPLNLVWMSRRENSTKRDEVSADGIDLMDQVVDASLFPEPHPDLSLL
ncbi:MAG: hypothetical protein AAGJ31_01465 [Verrucomicrobiota bacterium]